MASDDPRVQAIRCLSCHRLRPHPTRENPSCYCGGTRFEASFPWPDEEAWALTVYEDEIKERELWRYT